MAKKPAQGALDAHLLKLCRMRGILPSYRGMEGTEVHASPEAVCRVLALTGVDIASPAAAGAALRRLRREREGAPSLEPVTVAWDGEPPRVVVHGLGRARLGKTLRVEVELEDGGRSEQRARLEHQRATSAVVLKAGLPFGRHRVSVQLPREAPLSGYVLCAPRRAYQHPHPRTWALFAPTYALKEKGRLGGSVRELAQLGRYVGELGGSLLGTLPLLAAFPDDPSPYAPVSRLFYSELFLDLAALPEVCEVSELGQLWQSAAFRREVRGLGRRSLVDYPKRAELVHRVLSLASKHFYESGGARRGPFREFRKEQPHVEDYAAFRAVSEERGRNFRAWPARMADGRLRRRDADPALLRLHAYAQFRLHEQLSGLRRTLEAAHTGLYLDMPVGVHADGYDAYRFGQSLLQGASAGAPPDAFFSAGQDWGFAPPSPIHSRLTGHAYFAQAVRAQLAHAHALRIDHVMGLHRMFVIPHGAGAQDGVYVRYPFEELYAVLCLESHRAKAALVGENLGTVPPEVPKQLRRHGIAGMYLGQFAVEERRTLAPVSPVAPFSVASLNTHDTSTFAGFYHGDDVRERVALKLIGEAEAARDLARRKRLLGRLARYFADAGLISPAEARAKPPAALLRGWLGYLARSEAMTVLVNLEDLWLERRPQNVPGTYRERPNWKKKLQYDLDAIVDLTEVQTLLRELAARRVQPKLRSQPRKRAGSPR